jgi:uncharacterized protein (DUF2147 family)
MLAVILAASLAASGADGVIGQWRTETHHGLVGIERCGETICGRLMGSDGLNAHPDQTDVNNRDPALRQRPLLGLNILSGFENHDGEWTGGWIYNAQDGHAYKATIAPVDANHLKLRGCLFEPLCRSQIWTRVP